MPRWRHRSRPRRRACATRNRRRRASPGPPPGPAASRVDALLVRAEPLQGVSQRLLGGLVGVGDRGAVRLGVDAQVGGAKSRQGDRVCDVGKLHGDFEVRLHLKPHSLAMAAAPVGADRGASRISPYDCAAMSDAPSAAPIPSSTVALLRDAGDGVEVCMLRRPERSTFAAGAFVFPGGALDPADGIGDTAYAIAGIREVLEEVGILIGTSAAGAGDEDLDARVAAARAQVLAGAGFMDVLAAHGLEIIPERLA